MLSVPRFFLTCQLLTILAGCWPMTSVWASTPASLDEILQQIQQLKTTYETRITSLEQRLKQTEKQKAEDTEHIRTLERQVEGLKGKTVPTAPLSTPTAPASATVELKNGAPPRQTEQNNPPTASLTSSPMVSEGPIMAPTPKGSHLKRNGAVLIDEPDADIPFSMKANLSMEGRYSYFGRTKDYWTPNNQPPQTIEDYSVIELNRFMFMVSGYAFNPKLNYAFMMFGSSAAGAYMPLGYAGYDWMPEIKGRIGVSKAPGTREWTDSYNATLGADRTMATTYFRPNWTPGAWLEGIIEKTFYYELFVGNSFGGSSNNSTANRVGTGMLYSINGKWEPLGEMGFGISDLAWHDNFTMRLGGSGTYINMIDTAGYYGNSNPDNTIVRLSNGTPLNAEGALGPGSQSDSGDIFLGTLDWAFKYNGFALATEFMYRNLSNPGWRGTPGIINTLNDYGGYLQGSYFLLPKSLELFGRSSIVSGRFGTPWEAGGGVNWYPIAMVPNWIITWESLFIQNSPAQNLLTPYRAGMSGVVGQMQMKLSF
jgi:hypothetical protein